jgi:hypothetical protein
MEETKRPTMPHLISVVNAQIIRHPKYSNLDSNTRMAYEMSRYLPIWTKRELNLWSRTLWKHLYWSEPLLKEYDMAIDAKEATERMKKFGYDFH